MSGPTIIRPNDKSYTTVNGPLIIYFNTMDGLLVETWIKPEFIPPEMVSIKLDGKWWSVVPGGIGIASPVSVTILVERSNRP